MVVGPGGIGKSTLTREVLRELTRLERPVTLVNAEGAQSDADVAVRVAAACAPGRPVPQGFGFLRDVLGAGSVVLLDGLDALEDLPGLLLALRQELPDVRWVLTSRRAPRGGLDGGLDGGRCCCPWRAWGNRLRRRT
ncbi:ATP-binding protein [Deinococcus aquaticus]|uniref:ATP-binding protein n=1 Tax=Deinococcus aquaticus TaxID=328692 RepID=UPI003621F4CE